jgi:hypothetical protein
VDESVAALDEILTEQTAQAASSIPGGKKIGQ